MATPSPTMRTAMPAILACASLWLPAASAQDFLRVDSSPDTGSGAAPVQSSLSPGGFNIVINPGSGLASNTAALAAFTRAANQWAAHFSDPITINIDADLAAQAPGIIGSASSVLLQASYNVIRDQVVADAADEPDDAIVSFLPTAAQFSAFVNTGSSLTGNLVASKANLKALGFEDLDSLFGASDASITFSSAFSFDYDNSDGVGAGMMDFETVAAHEIGHALGFISEVDSADFGETALQPMVLDLFRFQNGTAADPSNSSEFTTFARNLVPGGSAIFDDASGNEWSFSTGVNTGDGRQASHWKDNLGLGIMDPTLAYGEVSPITYADIRAFDLIGYEAVPEPSVLLCSTLSSLALLRRRRNSNG